MAQIGFKSNKGVVRKNNEDACFVIPGCNVYIVADGVGGVMRDGEGPHADRPDEEILPRDLHSLHQPSVRRYSGKDKTGLLQSLPVVVVELVSVSVALVDG